MHPSSRPDLVPLVSILGNVPAASAQEIGRALRLLDRWLRRDKPSTGAASLPRLPADGPARRPGSGRPRPACRHRGNLTLDEWTKAVDKLGAIGDSVNWSLGDLLVYAAAKGWERGDTTLLARRLGTDRTRLYQLAYVARHVGPLTGGRKPSAGLSTVPSHRSAPNGAAPLARAGRTPTLDRRRGALRARARPARHPQRGRRAGRRPRAGARVHYRRPGPRRRLALRRCVPPPQPRPARRARARLDRRGRIPMRH